MARCRRNPGRRVLAHAFIRNGDSYYLTDLKIYADGMVDCWGLVPFEEFAAKVLSGWVATTFDHGARASCHGVASWTMTRPHSAVEPDDLIAEVGDILRAKFAQHPELADRLVATGDAVLVCFTSVGSRFWERYGDSGYNWVGRLLEVVRAELALARAVGEGDHGDPGDHGGPADHGGPGDHGGPADHGGPGDHGGPRDHGGPGDHGSRSSATTDS
jgi:hypothetical protein